jgi:hypothetical protein
MRAILATAALALVLAGGAVRAQAPQGGADERARIEAALELFEVQGGSEGILDIVEVAVEQIVQALARKNPGREGEIRSLMSEILVPAFRGRAEDIRRPIAAIYAARFSVDELREITVFFRTPVGRKLAREQGAMGIEAMAVGSIWAQRVAQDALARHRDAIAARGLNL